LAGGAKVAERCFAVLLDAGFLKYALKRKRKDPPITADLVQRFIHSIENLPALEGARLHRVYFYDAKPLTGKVKKPDGTELDFSASELTKISNQQHGSIARLPYIAMRFGELSYRGWQVKESLLHAPKMLKAIAPKDLVPNVQQKGVDMRIGLDIASLTLKKQAQVIVLVSGDSDLVPAMKFARREGSQLVLITLGNNVKEAMLDHADVVYDDKTWIDYPGEDAEAKAQEAAQPA
jgi:uncharacterized LabA/DUF88 family protein